MKLLAKNAQMELQIPLEKFGPPGIRGELHFVAQMPTENRSDVERLNDNSERQFKVSARLSKLPPTAENISAGFTEKDGNSYLLMPDNAVLQKVATSFGAFIIKGNEVRELSLAEFECVATDKTDARLKFLNAILPYLDHIAFIINSPVFIKCVRVEDQKNYTVTIDYVSPYRKATINSHESHLFTVMKCADAHGGDLCSPPN